MAVVPLPFECEVRPDRELVVVTLSGELDLATTPEAAKTIGELVEAGFERLRVDLSRLSFIDSSGLRMLIRASRAAAERGCEFTVVPGSEAVQRAFEVTRLHSHFTFEMPHP